LKVRLSVRARRQIDSSLAYVHARSPQGAEQIGRRLLELLDLLAQTPEIGKRIDEPGLRRLHLSPYPYLLDYNVRRDEVVVLRFRHAARRP